MQTKFNLTQISRLHPNSILFSFIGHQTEVTQPEIEMILQATYCNETQNDQILPNQFCESSELMTNLSLLMIFRIQLTMKLPNEFIFMRAFHLWPQLRIISEHNMIIISFILLCWSKTVFKTHLEASQNCWLSNLNMP